VDIRSEFGQRVRGLRARSGMSQEMLAHRAGLDRTYISGVERGDRNISIINIERIAAALYVSIGYIFSGERLSINPAYLQKDFTVPFLDRFKFQLDSENKVLAFQVHGLLTGSDVDYISATLLGICSTFGKDELNVLVDHREMKAADGEPVVYSPEVAERAIVFQQELAAFSKRVVALCNSEFMVHQLNRVTKESGLHEKAIHLFGQDKEMVCRAYELLDIKDNELIKIAK
jgi:transcriptional regulator with XRE-family HTH domain